MVTGSYHVDYVKFIFLCLHISSALHYAASMTGEPSALRLLIKLGSNVNSLNDENNSPLFMAVLANNEKAAAALIENGAGK